jgi:hypothetical protein
VRAVSTSKGDDALSAVCQALGCPDPFGSSGSPIELGAAWAAVPDENAYIPKWKARWQPALRAYITGGGPLVGADFAMEIRTLASAPRQRFDKANYPALPSGSKFQRTTGRREMPMSTEIRVGTVTWSQAASTQAPTDLTYCPSSTYDRWLLPAAPGSDASFTVLTAWWVLLFGLSIFARYHPALWVTTLNLDRRSGRALPLRLLLDRALDDVPVVVADALLYGHAMGGG